jgi:hypothetical protein
MLGEMAIDYYRTQSIRVTPARALKLRHDKLTLIGNTG